MITVITRFMENEITNKNFNVELLGGSYSINKLNYDVEKSSIYFAFTVHVFLH